MKVRASIHVSRQLSRDAYERTLDVEKDLGIPPADWAKMNDAEKDQVVRDWAADRTEISWDEIED